jgi:hypothetical protein
MPTSLPDYILPTITYARDVALRAAYYFHIPHVYHLGGFQLYGAPGIDLDKLGLDWVRTNVVFSQRDRIGYRVVHHEDLTALLGHDFPSEEQVIAMYGNPVSYEQVGTRLGERLAHLRSPTGQYGSPAPTGR